MNTLVSCLSPACPPAPPTVGALYLEHADFVRRVLSAGGVTASSLEDGVQDVFLVVFRRFADFVPRASYRTWICGIALRVAKDYRRRTLRKGGLFRLDELDVACPGPDPCAAAQAAQALRGFRGRLFRMDEARRRIFILAELEEMTAPEIAKALRLNLNTVYSRLRSARREVGVPPTRSVREPAPSTSSVTLG
jgi:RNA polymerase sigma-70 factor (ECF subfamily)